MDVDGLADSFSGWQIVDRTAQLQATLSHACPQLLTPLDGETAACILQVLDAATDDAAAACSDGEDAEAGAPSARQGSASSSRRPPRRAGGRSQGAGGGGDDADDEMEEDDDAGANGSGDELRWLQQQQQQQHEAEPASAPLLYICWDPHCLAALDGPDPPCPGGVAARDAQLAAAGIARGTPAREAVALMLSARLPAAQQARDLFWRDPRRAGTCFLFQSYHGYAMARHALARALPYVRATQTPRFNLHGWAQGGERSSPPPAVSVAVFGSRRHIDTADGLLFC